MTTTATETDLIPVGTQVRVTELWSGGAEVIRVGDTGKVESHNPACCGGEHKYVIRTDEGREFAVKDVERVDPETPQFAVGDRVRLMNGPIGGAAEVGDLGTVVEVPSPDNAYFYVRFDGRSGGARGDGVYALTSAQVRQGYLVKVEGGSQPSEPVDTDVQAKIDAAVAEALASYKERVKSVALDYAERHDWCSVAEQALEEMGIDATPESESHTVTIQLTYTPGSRTDEGIDTYNLRRMFESYAGDYVSGSIDVEDVTID